MFVRLTIINIENPGEYSLIEHKMENRFVSEMEEATTVSG